MSQHVPSRNHDAPLRVLFVITSMPVGGAETLLVQLIRGLDRTRFAPELCCLKQLGPLGEELSREIPTHSRLLGHKYDALVLARLLRLLRRRRIDAVVTVGAGDKMFWGRLAAWLAGVPVVISALHSTGWPDEIGRLNRALTSLTDCFIAVARRHGRYLVEKEGLPNEKVRVIPNGVDSERFRPRADLRAGLRRSLDVPRDAPVCGVVAALRPEKNHALFLHVAASVRQEFPAARFLVVGDGPERTSLEQLANDLGLANAVKFLGTRGDIPALLSALDVFVLTSDNEASPVSILEAMSTQLPVVATRVGSIEEVVHHGVHGLLAPRGDAKAISEHVVRLLRDRKLAGKMGRAGRENVVAHGSHSTMVTGYENLLADIHAAKCGSPSSLAAHALQTD